MKKRPKTRLVPVVLTDMLAWYAINFCLCIIYAVGAIAFGIDGEIGLCLIFTLCALINLPLAISWVLGIFKSIKNRRIK